MPVQCGKGNSAVCTLKINSGHLCIRTAVSCCINNMTYSLHDLFTIQFHSIRFRILCNIKIEFFRRIALVFVFNCSYLDHNYILVGCADVDFSIRKIFDQVKGFHWNNKITAF